MLEQQSIIVVLTKKKWCCGWGYKDFHYCEFCGTPYESYRQAAECEASHQVKV